MPTDFYVNEIVVDRDRCIACGACTAVCPTQALIIEGSALAPVPERCRPCGQAAIVCPTGALTCPEAAGSQRGVPAPGTDDVRTF